MDERHVVTCFLIHAGETGDQLLVVRRSQRVSTYQGRWAAISGTVETTPEQQAWTELAEEASLDAGQARLRVHGAPLSVEDAALKRRWVVHPFLFQIDDPAAIRLDWEQTEARWIAPTELAGLDTVPALTVALAQVYRPAPTASAEGGTRMDPIVATILDGYREVHQQFRAELDGLDPALLHRRPAPETSSIAVLIHHTLGSEAQVVRLVAGVPAPRDRAAEFRVTEAELDAAGLRAELDATDRLLDELGPRINADRLLTLVERAERTPHTGIHWLVTNYGHAREHLAQLQLTRQLLAQV